MSARRRAVGFALALAVLTVGVAGCGGGSHGGGGARVSVADLRFSPPRIQVNAGQRVTWKNSGQTAHTVKGPGFFSTRAMDPGQSYSHRFARPGTYPYLCTLTPP